MVRAIRVDELDLRRYARPGDLVVWGQACAEPLALVGRLVEQRADLSGVQCFTGLSIAKPLRTEHLDHLRAISYLGGLPGASILPSHYSDLGALLSTGRLRADIVLLQAPPPDAGGRFSFGLAADYVTAAAANARCVIVEVNPDAPFTFGASMDASRVAAVVASTHPVPVPVSSEPTETERHLARRVAELIPDDAVIQTGIGRLPDLVLSELKQHRGLRLHSGVLGDGVVDLVAAGAVVLRTDKHGPSPLVTGLLMGSERLRSFAHRNSALSMRPISHTHDPQILARQDRLVAINSALQVDLFGSVNTESVGGRYIGGVGGAVDFARGAGRSRDGFSVIALTSTAGTRSRIVTHLAGPSTIPRSDVGLVVTEHGVADLRGRTLDERRQLMIAVADPTHRADLERHS